MVRQGDARGLVLELRALDPPETLDAIAGVRDGLSDATMQMLLRTTLSNKLNLDMADKPATTTMRRAYEGQDVSKSQRRPPVRENDAEKYSLGSHITLSPV